MSFSPLDRPERPADATTISRRDFVKTSAALAGASLLGLTGRPAGAGEAGPTPTSSAETAVARFYRSLKPEQRTHLCFPFDHPLRSRVSNNWAIVKPKIDDLSPEQQALCREIFKNLTSEDGFDRFSRLMENDYGGFEQYHVAVFGEPGTDKPFEWVITGRHVTMRADGNSLAGAAFGGPVFYGHAARSFNEDARHTDNVWWYQGEQANKIFQTFDEKQRAQALLTKALADEQRSIQLRGEEVKTVGLGVETLDGQQKQMVKDLLEMMMRPYRAPDVAEIRECLDEAGGIDKLRLTYYSQDENGDPKGDIGGDGVWDIWKLEGPAFAWYFHGSPHVHTWLNVQRRA